VRLIAAAIDAVYFRNHSETDPVLGQRSLTEVTEV
jgi:hypothetical protein